MHTRLPRKSHWTLMPAILLPAMLVWIWWYFFKSVRRWLKCSMPTYSMPKSLTTRQNWTGRHLCCQSPEVVWALVAFFFQWTAEEVIGQNASLGHPWQPRQISKYIHPLMSSIPASSQSKINSSGMSVILIRTYSGSSIGVSR